MNNIKMKKKEIRAQLLLNNLTIEGFARKHNFNIRSVKSVISRYWGTDYKPRGKITLEILETLKSYMNK